jgi:serine/threonine protein kinase
MVLPKYKRCFQINSNDSIDEQGSLPDGTDVAVKKLNGRQTTQAAAEFLTEVKLLTSVRHRNLVRLLGCCTRGHERLLVYEFMSQNSLHKHLFGRLLSSILCVFARFESILKIMCIV